MKKLSIISLFILVFIVSAAAQKNRKTSKALKYKVAESGLSYHFFIQNKKGIKAQEGDVVKVILSYLTNKDSIIFNSKDVSKDGSNAIEFPLSPSTFKGSFEDALSMMCEGDSASFRINADSIYLKTFRASELPSYIERGSSLTFYVKLLDIKTKEQVMKEGEEKRKKELEAMEKRKSLEAQEIAGYIADHNIKTAPTASGLYFIETLKGAGAKVVAGKTVQVNYKGLFVNGDVFDASEGRGPFEFTVGEGQVIQGWDEALQMMNVGGSATLLIPSSLAYGESDIGYVIPPYTPLVFEVEVVSIK